LFRLLQEGILETKDFSDSQNTYKPPLDLAKPIFPFMFESWMIQRLEENMISTLRSEASLDIEIKLYSKDGI